MTVKFIDGPLDGQLLVIPPNYDVWRVSEVLLDINAWASAPIPIKLHYYHRAFEGSVYFKYQGTVLS